jgi:hypothetical protein
MTELTNSQWDALERAIVKGSRISVYRRGTEFVIVPLAIRVVDGRDVISAKNPKTGDGLELFVDELERIEVVA